MKPAVRFEGNFFRLGPICRSSRFPFGFNGDGFGLQGLGSDGGSKANGFAVLRMCDTAVVALAGILDDQFPVGVNLVSLAVAHFRIGQFMGPETWLDACTKRPKVRGAFREAYKNQSFDNGQMRAKKPVRSGVKSSGINRAFKREPSGR